MSQDTYSSHSQTRPIEGDARHKGFEGSLRTPFLFFFASAVIWLLISSLCGLLASIELSSKFTQFINCEVFTYGRLISVERNIFIYGWAFNAFFALNLWLLSQLGRFDFRNSWLALLGGAVWNLTLTYGVARIFSGEMNSFRLLEMPREVGPVLAVSFMLAAFWPIVAFSRRSSGHTFASQWFVVGATIVFPLVYLLVQLMVLWVPASGVVQALAHSWFIANLMLLWLGASAIAATYYFLPKILERTIEAYYLAPVAFWTFFLFAGWSGTSALVGSPVPLWLQSAGVVAAAMLMVPVIIISLNLVGTLCRQAGWVRAWNDTTLRFISFGVVAFTVFGILNSVTAFRGPSARLRFTSFSTGVEQLLTYGFVTMVIFGASYFILPRLTNTLWPSVKLVYIHFWGCTLGILGSLVALLIGGCEVATQLSNPSTPFADILRSESKWFFLSMVSSILLFVGHAAFAFNIFGMFVKSTKASVPSNQQ